MGRYFVAPKDAIPPRDVTGPTYQERMQVWFRANGIDPGVVLQTGILLTGGVLHYTEIRRGRPDETGYRPLLLSRDGTFKRRRRVRIRIGYFDAQRRAGWAS